MPRETVWKIETVTILDSHEWADRDQQALFGHLMLPETTFNKPSSYCPDSLYKSSSRKLRGKRRARFLIGAPSLLFSVILLP